MRKSMEFMHKLIGKVYQWLSQSISIAMSKYIDCIAI